VRVRHLTRLPRRCLNDVDDGVPYSAPLDATMTSMMEIMLWIMPFSMVGSRRRRSMRCRQPLIVIRIEINRYDASACSINCIFDLWNTTALSGYAAYWISRMASTYLVRTACPTLSRWWPGAWWVPKREHSRAYCPLRRCQQNRGGRTRPFSSVGGAAPYSGAW
jgi:hypothetical protein